MVSAAEFLSLSDASDRLGVGKEQVRRYVQRGLLPATKLANCWMVSAAHVEAFNAGKPNDGRPLSETNAWSCIFAGDVNLDDPHRYINRGVLTRWNGTSGAVADLLLRDDIVVSGIHASLRYGALLEPLATEAQIYVQALTLGALMHGFSLSPLGGVCVRSVSSRTWSLLTQNPGTSVGSDLDTLSASCAPPAAVALDLALSKHPRERFVAEQIAESL